MRLRQATFSPDEPEDDDPEDDDEREEPDEESAEDDESFFASVLAGSLFWAEPLDVEVVEPLRLSVR